MKPILSSPLNQFLYKNLLRLCFTLLLVSPLTAWSQILGGGHYHSLVVCEDRRVQAWGWDNWDQASTTNAESPAYVPGVENVIGVAGGQIHSIALRANGTVLFWGSNTWGQAGLGTQAPDGLDPIEVAGVENIVQIASADYTSYALTDQGRIIAWGRNGSFEMGPGLGPRTPDTLSLFNVERVIAGSNFAMALLADGTVSAWGGNQEGQLGRGTTTSSGPINPVPGLENIVEIAAGLEHAMAMEEDGTVWAWGANGFGQLGTGNATPSYLPVQVNIPAGVVKLELADNTSAALMDDGTVYTWGGGGNGTLGDGTLFQNNPTPTPLENFGSIVDLEAGGSHYLAVDSENQLYAWGRNFEGQVSVGSSSVSSPSQVTEACVLASENADHLISGRVFRDVNENCNPNLGDQLPPIPIMVSLEPSGSYTFIDELGMFVLPALNGETYSLTANFPTAYQQYLEGICPEETIITPTEDDPYEMTGNNIGVVAADCPLLKAEVTSTSRRICTRQETTITVSNYGFVAAENVPLTLKLPQYVEFISSEEDYTEQADGSFLFTIPQINSGTVYQIDIIDSIACLVDSLDIGFTQCTEVSVSPLNYLCTGGISPEWDGSSVEVSGICSMDSLVQFYVSNTGAQGGSDMTAPSEFRIYVDNLLWYTGVFELPFGDSLEVIIPSDGSTFRMEADQSAHHPGFSLPRATVEACAGFEAGFYSAPYDDFDWERSIECLPITGSFDPNDKQVVPAGITEENYIDPESVLEYTIRFQNTGNDFAQRVVLRDTISPLLDLASLEVLSASHSYEVELTADSTRVLSFIFDDIFLPDSASEPLESIGFVKFNITPNEDLPNGTIIENFVDIYFDFNSPIRTNTPWVQLFDTVLTAPDDLDLCFNTATSTEVSACNSYSLSGGNVTWTESGVYTDTLVSVLGCDSVVTVTLALTEFEAGIFGIENILFTDVEDAQYQWLDCDAGFIPIPEENQIEFDAPNGNFAVVVTTANCVDTTDCYTVSGLGTSALYGSTAISVFPNPTNGNVTVSLPALYPDVHYQLFDVTGRQVLSGRFTKAETFRFTFREPEGMYYLKLSSVDKILVVRRIMKLNR